MPARVVLLHENWFRKDAVLEVYVINRKAKQVPIGLWDGPL